jgi:hypothetical protein
MQQTFTLKHLPAGRTENRGKRHLPGRKCRKLSVIAPIQPKTVLRMLWMGNIYIHGGKGVRSIIFLVGG